jgi:mono/diheme cytochrome c family protein
VGFSRHEDQVGLTCAACHTTQINYQGTAMRIDGAPALADMIGLFEAIQAALAATLADEAKLARFAAAVPRGGTDEAAREAARKSIGQTLAWFQDYNRANHSGTQGGFGRLDAIGRIINQVIRFTSGSQNSLEPNAPTNFPELWDAPHHDYVQWTGFAPNADGGSIGRNAGEVIGVFAHVEVKHHDTEKEAKKGYDSTITARDLAAMEDSLWHLKSPRWPEDILPKIDRSLAARGEALYQSECLSCHAAIDRNLVGANIPTGVLAGAVSAKGVKYGDKESALVLLVDLVAGSLARHPVSAVKALADSKLHGLKQTTKHGDHPQDTAANPSADLLSYKARPLNGIWASPPYLHNGSVPTLYDLLLPPAERPSTFAAGRWEFDPRKVGRVTDGPFVVDTGLTGNSNRGHEYGTKLSDADRWALVEYLKTL